MGWIQQQQSKDMDTADAMVHSTGEGEGYKSLAIQDDIS